jgi:hypothetical protein
MGTRRARRLATSTSSTANADLFGAQPLQLSAAAVQGGGRGADRRPLDGPAEQALFRYEIELSQGVATSEFPASPRACAAPPRPCGPALRAAPAGRGGADRGQSPGGPGGGGQAACRRSRRSARPDAKGAAGDRRAGARPRRLASDYAPRARRSSARCGWRRTTRSIQEALYTSYAAMGGVPRRTRKPRSTGRWSWRRATISCATGWPGTSSSAA